MPVLVVMLQGLSRGDGHQEQKRQRCQPPLPVDVLHDDCSLRDETSDSDCLWGNVLPNPTVRRGSFYYTYIVDLATHCVKMRVFALLAGKCDIITALL